MPQFLLLLRDEGNRDWTPQEMQSVIQRYAAWREKLQAAGRMTAGNKLRDAEGRVLRRNGDAAITVMDGPFVETKEILAGFFAVTADSYEDAVALTHDCPHFDFGSIEVRQVEETRRP
jgi:hypothetical protein